MSTAGLGAIGAAVERRDARAKVSGEAVYASEQRIEGVAYAALVQSRTPRGRITAIDASRALALPGVLTVLSHQNAPRVNRVASGELFVLQEPQVAYYGQIVAAVVAETLEVARDAADLVVVTTEPEPHDVSLRVDHPGLYRPEHVAFRQTEAAQGDVDSAVAEAPIVVEQTFTTPAVHNLPMEPHASLAIWDADGLTVYESTQFPHGTRSALARAFDLDPDTVRVIGPMVGGGFGSKGSPRPQLIVAAMAAQATGRPVKITLTRREMFPISGHRSPTIQQVRLAATRDGVLTAWEHRSFAQTSKVNEYCEPCTSGTRTMYAADNRFDTHRVVRLDVPSPGFCRAPGEAPGFFAVECAMDELAERCGIDPVELRIRNEPERDPHSGLEFSSRNLVACLQEGAERFGWWDRASGQRGNVLLGYGVASSMHPTPQQPSSARVTARPGRPFLVEIAAADVGTGAQTALAQIAADELGVSAADVEVELGDSDLPYAIGAFGSLGTASWGHAVVLACRSLRDQLAAHDGDVPDEGLVAFANTEEALAEQQPYVRHAFGAQFAEVAVDADTGEIRVTRLLGVFAAGRIVNARTARSQLLGGMTWGLSMALHEHSVMDGRDGDFVTKDLASYHIAGCADVPEIEAYWIDEHDPHLNPSGTKGVGELGIVGTAAAIANAVYDATGIRVRDLPITLDKLLGQFPSR